MHQSCKALCKIDRCSFNIELIQNEMFLLIQCLTVACVIQDRRSGFSFQNGKDNKKEIKLLQKSSPLVYGWFSVIPCFVSLVGKSLFCFQVNQNSSQNCTSPCSFSVTLLKNSNQGPVLYVMIKFISKYILKNAMLISSFLTLTLEENGLNLSYVENIW